MHCNKKHGPVDVKHFPLKSFQLYPDQTCMKDTSYTLKTSIPIEEGDSVLKLLRTVSLPEIQLLSHSGSCIRPRSF